MLAFEFGPDLVHFSIRMNDDTTNDSRLEICLPHRQNRSHRCEPDGPAGGAAEPTFRSDHWCAHRCGAAVAFYLLWVLGPDRKERMISMEEGVTPGPLRIVVDNKCIHFGIGNESPSIMKSDSCVHGDKWLSAAAAA